MTTLPVHNVSTIPAYSGPHAIPGVRFRAVRQALGVTAWGMNLLELDPHCEGHPTHDHAADGQEEVYIVLSGSVQLVVDGVIHELSQGDLVRVPAEATRQLRTTDQPTAVLALGGTPERAYSPSPGM